MSDIIDVFQKIKEDEYNEIIQDGVKSINKYMPNTSALLLQNMISGTLNEKLTKWLQSFIENHTKAEAYIISKDAMVLQTILLPDYTTKEDMKILKLKDLVQYLKASSTFFSSKSFLPEINDEKKKIILPEHIKYIPIMYSKKCIEICTDDEIKALSLNKIFQHTAKKTSAIATAVVGIAAGLQTVVKVIRKPTIVISLITVVGILYEIGLIINKINALKIDRYVAQLGYGDELISGYKKMDEYSRQKIKKISKVGKLLEKLYDVIIFVLSEDPNIKFREYVINNNKSSDKKISIPDLPKTYNVEISKKLESTIEKYYQLITSMDKEIANDLSILYYGYEYDK